MNNSNIFSWAKTDTSFMSLKKYNPESAEYNTVDNHLGPDNKREMPCVGCSNEVTCAAKGLECSAFRNWSAKGDFKDSDIQRYLRGMK